MAQTQDGAIKIAAKKIGISERHYRDLVAAGQKWCTACKKWHPVAEFASDRSRRDGLTASCREARNTRSREVYTPVVKSIARGRSFVPARDGDAKQARRRINYFVESGIIPHPNQLACSDCGHEWSDGERRHEYDHYLGYAADHHEDVEPVCTTCHATREGAR